VLKALLDSTTHEFCVVGDPSPHHQLVTTQQTLRKKAGPRHTEDGNDAWSATAPRFSIGLQPAGRSLELLLTKLGQQTEQPAS
jgi:hypothetical protein